MAAANRARAAIQWAGLAAGPLAAVICLASLPEQYRAADGRWVEFTWGGRGTLAVMVLMAVWWLTEAIDLAATSLIPLALFPLFGVADMSDAAAPYAHPLIFLYMGGFLLALSMQRWQLDRRIALHVLSLVGTRPRNVVAGFMLITAVFSGFVSNTATTAMMLPIALSVVQLTSSRDERTGDADPAETSDGFAPCLMLAVAYSASIGGISTIIGSPTNLFLVSFLRESVAAPYRTDVSFVRWFCLGAPFTAIFLPIAWWLLTRWLFPLAAAELHGGRELIRSQLAALGQAKRAEWATLVVFLATATTWIIRPILVGWEVTFAAGVAHPLAGLSDAGIALIGALVLFVIPVDVRSRTFVLDWETARKLPWGVLILFGGGLSLADAVDKNGVAEFIGSFAGELAGAPPLVLILAVTTGVIFLTELTSNVATAATLLPVLAALAPGLRVHPYLLIFPAAIAASCAFMLPVATPPNAIVFGGGYVKLPEMVRAGLWMNLVGIALVTAITYCLLTRIVAM